MSLRKRVAGIEKKLRQLECEHNVAQFLQLPIVTVSGSGTYCFPPPFRNYFYEKTCANCGKLLGTVSHSEYLEHQKKELEDKLHRVNEQLVR